MKTLEENVKLADKILQLDELPLQRVLGILEGVDLNRAAQKRTA